MKKINLHIKNKSNWIITNREKILYVILVYGGTTYVLRLPYINLISLIIAFLPFLLTWVLILILFKPNKIAILKCGLSLFVLNFLVTVVKFENVSDFLGIVSYLLIASYIVVSLREVRRENR